MQLVYMEGMDFARAIFDGPVLDIALVNCDIRVRGRIENLRLTPVFSNEEERCAFRISGSTSFSEKYSVRLRIGRTPESAAVCCSESRIGS